MSVRRYFAKLGLMGGKDPRPASVCDEKPFSPTFDFYRTIVEQTADCVYAREDSAPGRFVYVNDAMSMRSSVPKNSEICGGVLPARPSRFVSAPFIAARPAKSCRSKSARREFFSATGRWCWERFLTFRIAPMWKSPLKPAASD